jgi:protein O-GlcNAc transferase
VRKRAISPTRAIISRARYRPDDAAIRYNLGTALLALGRYDEAASQLETALRIQPNFPQAEANLAAARAAVR